MKNSKQVLFIGLSLLLVISICLWLFSKSTFQDFGINLCTEVLGIIITVLFIEKIIALNKVNEHKPILAAAYYDIGLLVSRYIDFFQELYQKSVAEPEPKMIEQFMRLEIMNKIFNNVDMTAMPHVFPTADMFSYFKNTAKNIYQLGSTILDRHGWHLDPIVYKKVHDITESFFINNLKQMSAVKKMDIENNWPRPQILAAYSILPDQAELDAVLLLFKWCENTRKNLSDTAALEQLFEYTPQLIVPEKLDYRKDPYKLNEEIKAWQKFQNK